MENKDNLELKDPVERSNAINGFNGEQTNEAMKQPEQKDFMCVSVIFDGMSQYYQTGVNGCISIDSIATSKALIIQFEDRKEIYVDVPYFITIYEKYIHAKAKPNTKK